MTKTERLYYADPYLREFEARVVETRPDQRGTLVYLDRSAFYPESGGQPADRGTFAGIPVLDVFDEGDAVPVLVDRAPDGESVTGVIDWTRRFDHMQQHTGQHILSAAFEHLGRYKTVSFHLGTDVSTIDLDSGRLSRREMDLAEDTANQIVFEDREVQILFRSADEAGRMDLRKPKGREGEVRLIQVENFDLSACGGTHVRRTGAVGLIAVRKFERAKGNTRVEFVCGGRALKSARRDFLTLSEAGRLLSSALDQVPEMLGKQANELRAASREREKLIARVAEYRARELAAAAPERNGRRIVRALFQGEELLEAKLVAQAIGKLASAGIPLVALIAARGVPDASGANAGGTLFFSQTPGGSADLNAILKNTVAAFGGRGGGTRDFAQGGGVSGGGLEAALDHAEGLLG
jgi:alanyl-tRNA synthetase